MCRDTDADRLLLLSGDDDDGGGEAAVIRLENPNSAKDVGTMQKNEEKLWCTLFTANYSNKKKKKTCLNGQWKHCVAQCG